MICRIYWLQKLNLYGIFEIITATFPMSILLPLSRKHFALGLLVYKTLKTFPLFGPLLGQGHL